MDFRSLLQSMSTLSEGDVVHKGTYGTSHGSEDVRDQYGHKIGKVNKDAAAKKPEVKRGRGRPKKGSDETGEVKKYDWSAFGGSGKDVKLPKWDKSKTTKHSLKEYIEEVEQNQQLDEAEQVTIAPAQQSTQIIKQGTKTLGTVSNPQLAQQIKQAIGQGQMSLMPGKEDMTEVSQGLATKAFAKRTSHAWDLGDMSTSREDDAEADKASAKADKTYAKIGKRWGHEAQKAADKAADKEIFGDRTDEEAMDESGLQAYLGNKKYGKDGMAALRKAGQEGASEKKMQTIRVKYSNKEEMSEGKDEGKPGKNFAKIAKKAGEKYGSKEAGERVAGAVRAKLAKQGKLEESVSLSESPETLEHIINKFKNEVKRFMAGEELDNDLYDALYDYYAGAGEMPYGVAKARTGDPYQWVFDRFEQDLPNHVDEGQYTTHGMNSGPKSMEPNAMLAKQVANKPVEKPTPWGVDPINAATDRAINFISGLGKPKKHPFEGKDMKDIQLESWEQQLTQILSEGITVSSSTGQQGAPDSVSVNATDSDAQQLLQVLRQAGVGVFGGHDHHVNGVSLPAHGDGAEPTGSGSSPEQAPAVAGDDGDILALIKKMTGIQDGGAQPGTLEPADAESDYEDEGGEEEQGQEGHEGSDEQGEEQTDEGNAFTGALAKAKQDGVQQGEKMDVDGDGTKETPVKEDDMEEGNMFTGNLAKARAQGKEQADLDGDGDMEKVHEGEETCNECGMYESKCECDHEQMNEFANDAGGDAMGDAELAELKTLLSMGNDMHKMKKDQTVGNPAKVTISVQEALTDWKKLSGIK